MAFDWGNALRGGGSGAAIGSTFGPWGTAIGAGVGALSGLFGGRQQQHEQNQTNQYLNQIPDELKQYMMPYVSAGQGALGRVGSEYGNLLSDPNAIINRIGAGYHESPGYQWRLGQGENAINNAAAAGGMAGTAQHQQEAGQLAENLANQDYWDFVDKGLGLYGTGLQGEQGLAAQGATTAGDLSTSLANLLQGRAGLSYQRGLNQNQQNSDLMSSIMSYLAAKKPGSIPNYANFPGFSPSQPTAGWGG